MAYMELWPFYAVRIQLELKNLFELHQENGKLFVNN